MVPISSTLAHSHTRSLKANSKCRRMCIIACGRSRMVHLFLAVGCEPSVPCLSGFVYRMDKVELRACKDLTASGATTARTTQYCHARPESDTKLLDHRPYRPRQDHVVRSTLGANRDD